MIPGTASRGHVALGWQRSWFHFPEPKPAGPRGRRSWRWPEGRCPPRGCQRRRGEQHGCHGPRTPPAARRCPQPPAPWQQLPAALLVCLPASVPCVLPPALLLLFFFFLFILYICFFLPSSRSAGRERGCRQRRGWEEGWGLRSSIWKAMGAHPSATAASREVTSFPPSALCSSPQRQRGWTGLSQQLLCLGLPLGPAAGVLLSAKPPPPPLPCVTSGAWPCCPRLWGSWRAPQEAARHLVLELSG